MSEKEAFLKESDSKKDFTVNDAYGFESGDIIAKRLDTTIGSKERFEDLLQGWPSLENSIGYTYDHSLAVKELSRESEYRKNAEERGLIRLFLLLASMHPLKRRIWATYLNIEFKKEVLGDAHHESWIIISEPQSGIIRLGKTPVKDRIRKVKNNERIEYHRVLKRVIKHAFIERDQYLRKNTSMSDEDKKALKEKLEQTRKTAETSNCLEIEELFLRGIANMLREVLKEELTDMLDKAELDHSSECTEISERLVAKGRFKTDDDFVLRLLSSGQMLSLEERKKIIEAVQNHAKNARESYAADILRLTVGISLAITMPIVLSPFSLIFSIPFFGFNLLKIFQKFRPGILIPVLAAIVMQRSFLASGDIDICDYYDSNSDTVRFENIAGTEEDIDE